MNRIKERILIVVNNPEGSDLIALYTLQELGYQVQITRTAAIAIQEAPKFSPDLIITDLLLPDLSGKDLMIALTSQGIEVPFIVIAKKGMELDIIQAFRIGATDHLLLPLREAEIVSVVERALNQVRTHRERALLAKQLTQTNNELQQRVRELTTLFAIGKAVTSITDMRELSEKIIDGAVFITGADNGWLLVRENSGRKFNLAAHRNLPSQYVEKINLSPDDELGMLVARSGEALIIHGAPLKRFRISGLGKSAMVVPVKLRKQVVGLLTVVRKSSQPFTPRQKSLLEAVADYSSISFVNVRLFSALQDRARSLQKAVNDAQSSEKKKEALLTKLQTDLKPKLLVTVNSLKSILNNQTLKIDSTQKSLLNSSLEQLNDVIQSLEAKNHENQS